MLQILNKLAIPALIFIISCTSFENNVDKTKKNDIADLNKIATEKFGEKFTLDYNTSKEFVICKNRNKSSIAGNLPIEYFIYNINKNQMIEENTIPLGNISWVSKYEVKVEIHPGIIQKNVIPDNGYIINVKTNLKTKINGRTH